MKYKIGDKVKYDGGDWWFYGTVSAAFEHSICPCYRLSVERMEKKNCKFSITQFEFELEPYNEDLDSVMDKREWEKSEIEYLNKYYGVLNNEDLSKMLKRSPQAIEEKRQQIKLQPKSEPEQKLKVKPEPEQKLKVKLDPEPEQKQIVKPEPEKVEPTKKTRMRKTSDAWFKNFELYRKGKKTSVVNAWTSKNRKDLKTGILSEDKLEKLMEINFPFDSDKGKKKVELTKNQKEKTPKRKRGEAWDGNFEAYCKGEKNNIISTWIAHNRKMYKEGKLSEDKFVKLMEINFPFDVVKKSR